MLKGLYKFAKKELSELGEEVGKDVVSGSKKVASGSKNLLKKGIVVGVYGVMTVAEGKPDKSFKEAWDDVKDKDYMDW